MSRAPEPAPLIPTVQTERKTSNNTHSGLFHFNNGLYHWRVNVKIIATVSNLTSWSDYASGLFRCGQREGVKLSN